MYTCVKYFDGNTDIIILCNESTMSIGVIQYYLYEFLELWL